MNFSCYSFAVRESSFPGQCRQRFSLSQRVEAVGRERAKVSRREAFQSFAHVLVGMILLAIGGAPGCAQVPAANQAQQGMGPLTIRTLAKGAFSGHVVARSELVRDQPAWTKFWNQHVVSARGATNLPPVEFEKELVLVATMGRKNSGGYTIEITRVEAEAKALKVYIRRKSPPPGAMSIQALTAPFHYVAVPATKLPVEFVEEK